MAPLLPTNVAVVHFPDVKKATEAVIEIMNQGVGIRTSTTYPIVPYFAHSYFFDLMQNVSNWVTMTSCVQQISTACLLVNGPKSIPCFSSSRDPHLEVSKKQLISSKPSLENTEAMDSQSLKPTKKRICFGVTGRMRYIAD